MELLVIRSILTCALLGVKGVYYLLWIILPSWFSRQVKEALAVPAGVAAGTGPALPQQWCRGGSTWSTGWGWGVPVLPSLFIELTGPVPWSWEHVPGSRTLPRLRLCHFRIETPDPQPPAPCPGARRWRCPRFGVLTPLAATTLLRKFRPV